MKADGMIRMAAGAIAGALALAVAAGCTISRGPGDGVPGRHGYADPASMNFDRPERATLYDMKTAVAELVADMLDDAAFREHYDLLASKKDGLPVLQIGNIENYSDDRVVQKLESARRRLEIALRKTRLFDVTDDAASAESVTDTLADSLAANANAGLKGDDGMQAFGEHASADYQMYGRYRSFTDGIRHSYELSLQLIDLHTGKQVWSDLAEIDKE